MGLLAFNKTVEPLPLPSGGGTVLPAAQAPGVPGPPVDVTPQVRRMGAGALAALEAARVAGDIDFAWVGGIDFPTVGLNVRSIASTAGGTYRGVFRAADRPSPSRYPVGAAIWNLDDNAPNYAGYTAPGSGVMAWVNAAGVVRP